MLDRTKIINQLIEQNRYTRYLEIGIDQGDNYSQVQCSQKMGVDPSSEYNDDTIITTTSDRFFHLLAIITRETEFDLIFIDGLHHADQCFKDMVNSLRFLAKGGTIVVHDVNPQYERQQSVPRIQADWTGDVWKSFLAIRAYLADKEVWTYDVETGLGIIQPRTITAKDLDTNAMLKAPMLHYEEMPFDGFLENKNELLNLHKSPV